MSDLIVYAVVLERSDGTRTPWRRAQVVEARAPEEAVRISLEGETWETEDGRYKAYAAVLIGLPVFTARKSTETTIELDE